MKPISYHTGSYPEISRPVIGQHTRRSSPVVLLEAARSGSRTISHSGGQPSWQQPETQRCKINSSLQWRYNERNGISNHQPHDCLLNRLLRRRSKKTPKLCVTGLCEENSPVTGEFPSQRGPVTRKMFPFDDNIMFLRRNGILKWNDHFGDSVSWIRQNIWKQWKTTCQIFRHLLWHHGSHKPFCPWEMWQ